MQSERQRDHGCQVNREERFFKWLRKTYPEVRLRPIEEKWICHKLRGEDVIWQGGRASGHTFIFNLLKEYLRRTVKLDLEFHNSIPPGVTPLEAIAMVKCLDEEGEVTWYKISTPDLNMMESFGMLSAAVVVAEKSVYQAFEPTD